MIKSELSEPEMFEIFSIFLLRHFSHGSKMLENVLDLENAASLSRSALRLALYFSPARWLAASQFYTLGRKRLNSRFIEYFADKTPV